MPIEQFKIEVTVREFWWRQSIPTEQAILMNAGLTRKLPIVWFLVNMLEDFSFVDILRFLVTKSSTSTSFL